VELYLGDTKSLESRAPPSAAAEIEAQLQDAAPWRFPQPMENIYQGLSGSFRRKRCAKVLTVAGIVILAGAILDLLTDQQLFIAGLPWRCGAFLLCFVCATMFRRLDLAAPAPMTETALVCVPVLANLVLTQILGEFGGRHADRYMMAAAFATSSTLCLLPLLTRTVRVCCGLCALAYLLVPALLPRDIPLSANPDLVIFAWGVFGLTAWIVRNADRRARIAFLYKRRHEISAAELGVLNAELWRLSTTDALTGLKNRRAFSNALSDHWRNTEQALAVALIDVDWFKMFNDSAGHVAGDAALQAVAQAIRTSLRRDTEMAARYGGEEFVILLPGATMADAASVAERVRHSVAALGLPHPGRPGRVVSISVGVACYDAASRRAAAADDMMRAADAALYAAKQRGRDCVALAGAETAIDAERPQAVRA
jgi:diguanylate cyclase (GGDEF)-like protein